MKTMPHSFLCRVLKNKEIAPGFFDLVVKAPEIAAKAMAGQFAHVACEGFSLRRPFSLCNIDRLEGTLRMVYEVRGQGTHWISTVKEGDHLDILAPLGHGFSVPANCRYPVLIGGGVGIPPLLQLATEMDGQATAFLGFRTAAAAILTADFNSFCQQIYVSSDDGTIGEKGLITHLLFNKFADIPCDYIAACGPLPMLKELALFANEKNITCQVSMEERMGCGIGACLVCACKTKAEQTPGWEYSHVCCDGPVFDARKVVWE